MTSDNNPTPEDRALGNGGPADQTIAGGINPGEAQDFSEGEGSTEELEKQFMGEGEALDALSSHGDVLAETDQFADQLDTKEVAQTPYMRRKKSIRRIGGLILGGLVLAGTALGIYRYTNPPPPQPMEVDNSELKPIPDGKRYDTSLLENGTLPTQTSSSPPKRTIADPPANRARLDATRTALTVDGVTVIDECFDDTIYEPVLTTPPDELYLECDPAEELEMPPTPSAEDIHAGRSLDDALANAEGLMQAETFTPPSDVPESERYLTYNVQKGEILSRILKEHTGLLYRAPLTQAMERHVASVNEIEDTHWIYPNQEIQIPLASKVHEVVQGESLSKIAKQYGVEWEQIAHDNQLEIEDREGIPHVHIEPNQELFVFGIDLEDVQGALPDTSSTGDGYAMQELSTEFEYLYNLIVSERALEQFESPLYDDAIKSDGELEGLVDGMWNHYEESGITIPRTIEYDSRLEAGAMKACDEETVSQFKFYQIANFAGVDESDLREHMKETCGKTYSDVRGEYIDQRALEVQEAYKEAVERGEAGIVSRLAADYSTSSSTIYRDLKRNPLDRMAAELLQELREDPNEPTEDEAQEDDTSDYTLTLGLGGYEHAAAEIREQMDQAD